MAVDDTLPVPPPLVTASDAAARYIRKLIFDGELADGSQVPRDAIARALGVSAVPVREALISLGREGWVSLVPNRGAFVIGLTPRTVHDHFEVYGLVYGLLARWGGERGTPEARAELRRLTERLGETDDPDEVWTLTSGFNNVLLAQADSPRLRATVRSLGALVPGNLYAEIPGAIANARSGFREIFDAIGAADFDGAAAACLDLMRRHGDLVVRELTRRGTLTVG